MAIESAGMYADFMDERVAQITEACTACGKCFEVCPMNAYDNFSGANSEQVTSGVLGILNGKKFSLEAQKWVENCEKSGVCIEACPEDVNPREMISYAKLKLKESAGELSEIKVESRDYFQVLSRTIRLMAALQIEPEVFKRLTAVRGGKKTSAESVFYFGCNILQTPHILLSCMDVFDRMGLDYEVAGGVAHCCGINHIRRGDLEGGAAMGRRSLDMFKAYNPENVITFCPTCQMQYTENINIYSGPQGDSLPFIHISRYLMERIDDLKALFIRPVNKRVAVHLHGGTDGVEENVQGILRNVPGLEVVEIEQHADHGYQCPTLHVPGAKDALHEKLFASAVAAGADSIATIYHGCHRDLCGEEGNHPVEVENFMSILGQAMGFEYPDWTKTFKLYEDMDRVLDEAGDLLRANGLNPENVREQLQKSLYS
ncbi:MAG: (Fe-S)-binding protein [Nitrospinaceae bacterium]|jgi:heterodisulfide reductase subunit D|nr:(Fe-S)-binding protein [Nitrospinaceae bacterium]MBT3433195.1 (Fe-S)-binding protein [Nitrospinaceae bacterium]MBT3822224.1 (Fe-S)-binding protein [Nitrospinaceae bacterium]MBT4093904.1 (Fe-S)-binding protein [Nitrospinaceae bacterium]MBT4431589.1 (Fe-S)-binding protein [Nitrospinaceae bacterium]